MLMEETTALVNHDSQSLITRSLTAAKPNHEHLQYSYYVIDVIGVPHISITEKYSQIIIVHNAMQTAIN